MSAHESIERLEKRLASWRVAQLSGPGWMKKDAGKVIKDLTAEIAARREAQQQEDGGQ